MVNKKLRNIKLPINHHPSTIARGYTLLEILVGITIISLIFAIGTASFREFSRRQAIAGTAKMVIADLRLTQSRALAGQKPSTCTTLDAYRFYVQSSTQYRIHARCACTNILVKTVNLPAGAQISSSRNPILFKSLAQGTDIPSGGSATITITRTDLGQTATVTVTAAGEIR